MLGLGLVMLSLPRGAFGACGHRSLSVATLVCLKQLDDGCVNPTHWPPAIRLPLLLCFFLFFATNRWYVLMANRMEKNTLTTHRFNLKSIVETLKKLVSRVVHSVRAK